MVPFTLIGCNQKKEEPITDKEESTIIKNATRTKKIISPSLMLISIALKKDYNLMNQKLMVQ